MFSRLEALKAQLESRDKQAAMRMREMKFKDAKLGRITFELARRLTRIAVAEPPYCEPCRVDGSAPTKGVSR